jgi:Fe-S-cluster-containing hydrogenase component 2
MSYGVTNTPQPPALKSIAMKLAPQTTYPLRSLQNGNWFKLICGASSQHIPTIRSCAIAYAIAGADCIDLAADPAIILSVKDAIAAIQIQYPEVNPWLMVSLNDGEDPHFRKAEFDPLLCPSHCDRPCEKVCPTNAIQFEAEFSGVIDERCYGCGRCLPICPIQSIQARSHIYAPDIIVPTVLKLGIDAIEIHTQIGRSADFTKLWQTLKPNLHQLKLIAVSCPDGPGMVEYLQELNQIIAPADLPCAFIWQTDGRPMSGDIGDGATRACIKLGQKVLALGLPGFVQLAGGTNDHTVEKLTQLGLFPPQNKTRHLAGVAYGSYARSQLQSVLSELEHRQSHQIEQHPDLLAESVKIATNLIAPLKAPSNPLAKSVG